MQRGTHGTEFWKSWNVKMNIPTDRTQKVDEKNGVICLVIMSTPRVMVIKMSRWLISVFSADDSKKLGQNI